MTGRILVVDDVPQNVRLLEAKLASEYYTVHSTYSGFECLEKVKDIQPDVILLDVMMPDMDGFETCRRLKADPETTSIPVVMVTALSEISDRVQGLTAGATDFITKPIDEVHLFARLKSLVRTKVVIDELRMRDKTGAELGALENCPLSSTEKIIGNILLVDDDIVHIQNMQEVLEEEGHIVNVSDPKEVENAFSKVDFDMVIISTMLDDIDGLRLGVQLRSKEETRHIPVLIIVDEYDKENLIKGLEIGIDDYITSPMEFSELIARTNTQLRRKKYQDALRLKYQDSLTAAVIDSLTQLYNRRYLDVHLNNIFTEALEKNNDLSLFTIDIDHFKTVNDTPGWGHDIGDEVLVEVANRIIGSVRTTDLSTRPGGEEFIVVMPNTDIKLAQIIAERTRHNIEKQKFAISADPGFINITVSIGVSSIAGGGDTPEALIKRSDMALFHAKKSGRNMVVVAHNNSG